MSKVTLSRVASLINAPTAINGILTQIEQAFDNCLSRDGSAPNAMTSSLDMNSNRILNLPEPFNNSEPVRVSDLVRLINPTTLVSSNNIVDSTVMGRALLTAAGVTVSQFKRALIAANVMQTVSDAIPADVTNLVNVQWFYGLSVYPNDVLYNFIQSTLGYSSAQMTALISAASSQQV